MKLYYSAGSCSTSCHITLEESGLKYEAAEIDWEDAAQAAVVEKLNPMGTLPVLTDKDLVLNQNIGIHTYVADQAPEKRLLPPAGTPERALVMNWLSFVASDLHKGFSPIFGLEGISPDKKIQEAVRTWSVNNVLKCVAVMESALAGKDYLTGSNFTIADAYAFVVLNWTQWTNIALDDVKHRNVKAYLARIHQRPAVQKVYQQEGL